MIQISGRYIGHTLDLRNGTPVYRLRVVPAEGEALPLEVAFVGRDAVGLEALDHLPEGAFLTVLAKVRTREREGRVYTDLQGLSLHLGQAPYAAAGYITGLVEACEARTSQKGNPYYLLRVQALGVEHPLELVSSHEAPVGPEYLTFQVQVRPREYQGRLYFNLSVQSFSHTFVTKPQEEAEVVPF